MRTRLKTIKFALITILFCIFGVLNVNAASSGILEMKLQKVNGLELGTKVNNDITSVQSMAITNNHFVFVMTNTNNEKSNNIFYVMDKNTHAFVGQYTVESCGRGNGITFNSDNNTLVVADGNNNRLIVYDASTFKKVREVKTGNEAYNSIAYDKDRKLYYLAQNKKSYITRYRADFTKDNSRLNVESYELNGGDDYQINQDLAYSNGYLYLTNHVTSSKMESSYSLKGFNASTDDAIIYTYNVVTGEKSKMFYNKAGSNATLGNYKELEGMDFIGGTPYLLFQRDGAFQVYTTGSIANGMAIKDDGYNYKKYCVYKDVRDRYKVTAKYDTRSKRGNIKITAPDGLKLIIVGFSEGVFTEGYDYNQTSNDNEASSLVDSNIIGKQIDDVGTYISVFGDAQHKDKVLKIKVANGLTDKNCMSYSDYQASNNKNKETFEDNIFITMLDLSENQPKDINNPQYNTICKVIRFGENYQGKYTNLVKKWDANAAAPNGNYQKLFQYCFNEKTKVEYTDENVESAIQSVIEAYDIQKMNAAELAKFESSSFLEAYNKSIERARAQGHVYDENHTKQETSSAKELKCNYKSIREKKSNGEYVYDSTNTKSYFGKEVKNVNATYTYKYDKNHDAVVDTKKVCTRTCYEAVDVEYGAPEAAVAGFAIQYQVKLTSRVRCESKVEIDPPEMPTICQPQPDCVHRNGSAITQGGPGEEFDACIRECDGGKYSQKCSKSCYQEVYGKQKSKKAKLRNWNYDVATESRGRYERYSDGSIHWVGSGYARWYIDHGRIANWEDFRNGGRFGDFDGFKKLSNSKHVDTCGADCSNINCADDTYLSQEELEADYVRNLNEYKNKVIECQAAAACSTKSSYYSMEVDYTQKDASGKTETKTIKFPGGKNTEERSCLKSLSTDGMTQANNGINSVVTCFSGCYANTSARNNYLSEISFPGTWVNNKSGEISYSTKREQDGWHYVDNQFFIPLNAAPINTDYWRYYTALKSEKVSSSSVMKSEVVRNYCADYTTYRIDSEKKVTTLKSGPDKYNIRANITDFGYMGWDFNVKCFYAVAEYSKQTIPATDKLSVSSKNICYPLSANEEPYDIRTVAKEDLFPSEGKGENTKINPNEPGRITGFNWTESAQIIPKNSVNEKGQIVQINSNYVNNPKNLLGDIQTRGTDIYGDRDEEENDGNEYLDYSFYLTPNVLKEIKSFGRNGSNNYTDFNGGYAIVGGVNAYYSDLIEKLDSLKAVRKTGNPGCNNDHESRTCIGLLDRSTVINSR